MRKLKLTEIKQVKCKVGIPCQGVVKLVKHVQYLSCGRHKIPRALRGPVVLVVGTMSC